MDRNKSYQIVLQDLIAERDELNRIIAMLQKHVTSNETVQKKHVVHQFTHLKKHATSIDKKEQIDKLLGTRKVAMSSSEIRKNVGGNKWTILNCLRQLRKEKRIASFGVRSQTKWQAI